MVQNQAVRFGYGQPQDFAGREPSRLPVLNKAKAGACKRYPEGKQPVTTFAVRKTAGKKTGPDLYIDIEFFAEFPPKGLFRPFTFFRLSARKLPLFSDRRSRVSQDQEILTSLLRNPGNRYPGLQTDTPFRRYITMQA